MRLLAPFACAWLSVFAVACGDAAEPYPHDSCSISATLHNYTEPLEDDGLLGFSGNDVMALARSHDAARLVWQSGEETSLELGFEAGETADVWAPPPDQGWCEPWLEVNDSTVRLTSGDGKLDFAVTTDLIGLGYDGAIDAIFPLFANQAIDAEERAKLPIPADWIRATHTVEELAISFRIQGATEQSPYCLVGQGESTDPDEYCNVYDGLIYYVARDPDAYSWEDDASFSYVLGWWTWSSSGD